MKRTLVAAFLLSATLSACAESSQDEAAPAPSVGAALSAPITIGYLSEDTDTLTATATVAASPRSIALQVRMSLAAVPPEVIAELRSKEELVVTLEDGLDAWTIREGVNGVASLDLEGLAGFLAGANRPTMCGSQIAKARVLVSDGTTTFPARVAVLESRGLFGLYDDPDCLEKETWEWSWVPPFRWQTAEWCESRYGGSGCSAVVDCGTALGGTRRCSGTCLQVDGVLNDVCKCDINETTCCNTPIPPIRPQVQQNAADVEF